MKNLWTPWRMTHVCGPKDEDNRKCPFDQADDLPFHKESLTLFRNPLTVVILNRFPYANGHLLVAPSRHVGDITEIRGQEQLIIMKMLEKSVIILREHLKPAGFNIGLNLGETAGAGLPGHLHFHIVPRWEGDHNFMTVLADVRTIPQHIEETFDLLLPSFQALLKELPC